MNQTETCCHRSLKVPKWSRLLSVSELEGAAEVLRLDQQTGCEIKDDDDG